MLLINSLTFRFAFTSMKGQMASFGSALNFFVNSAKLLSDKSPNL